MKTIKAELIDITNFIIDHEKPLYVRNGTSSSLGANWANRRDFQPGLSVEAIYHVRRGRRGLESAHLRVFDGLTEAHLALRSRAKSELYENPYGQYFLDALSQYNNREHPLVPIGIAGLVLNRAVYLPEIEPQ